MESNVLKAVEEISGYTPDEMIAMYNDYGRMAKEWEAYAAIGTVEELAALEEAAERIVLMWDNCYIEPYSADVKDYIERMRKAIKEADNDESGN